MNLWAFFLKKWTNTFTYVKIIDRRYDISFKNFFLKLRILHFLIVADKKDEEREKEETKEHRVKLRDWWEGKNCSRLIMFLKILGDNKINKFIKV